MAAVTERTVALGLMSGTSMDGIDAALVETDGERVFRRGPGATYAYPEETRALIDAAVEAAAAGRGKRSKALPEAEEAVTRVHAGAVETFLEEHGIGRERVDVIGFHGQTVLHRPERGITLQLGDARLLADLAGITVVNDFRTADMAAGGQGAPLAPVYHKALAERAGIEPPLAVVNIGGVANVTWIGRDGSLLAFDTGPGNALLDELAARHTAEAMDRDGRLAAQGTVDETALRAFLTQEYFGRKPPKSLDRKDFSLFLMEGMDVLDAAATLTAITAEAIALSARHMPRPPNRWIISGGGARNLTLMGALKSRLQGRVDAARALGWSVEFMEAEAFAYLAVRSLKGLPLSFPGTTGAPEPLSGGVTVTPSDGYDGKGW